MRSRPPVRPPPSRPTAPNSYGPGQHSCREAVWAAVSAMRRQAVGERRQGLGLADALAPRGRTDRLGRHARHPTAASHGQRQPRQPSRTRKVVHE